MKLRPRDRLFLDQHARADFDFTADAERIDALITYSLYRMRTNYLPVIILRTLTDCPHRLSVGGKTEEIEMAIVAHVRSVKHQGRSHGLGEQREFVFCIPEPDQSTRAGAILNQGSGRKKQIEGPVVVQISHVQTSFARKNTACIRDVRNFRGLPGLSFVLV